MTFATNKLITEKPSAGSTDNLQENHDETGVIMSYVDPTWCTIKKLYRDIFTTWAGLADGANPPDQITAFGAGNVRIFWFNWWAT
jgi:hypothetical protein